MSSKDETQTPVAPLTTALSTREYVVGGVFNGAMKGPGEALPKASSRSATRSDAVSTCPPQQRLLTGTAGIQPSIGYFGFDFPGVLPDGILPGSARTSPAASPSASSRDLSPTSGDEEYKSSRAVGVHQQLPREDRRVRGESFIGPLPR